jgi:hypothetical protein
MSGKREVKDAQDKMPDQIRHSIDQVFEDIGGLFAQYRNCKTQAEKEEIVEAMRSFFMHLDNSISK